MFLKPYNKYYLKIYGDMHTLDDFNNISNIVKKEKPDYFLCEFLLNDRVMNSIEAKNRLDNSGAGKLCDPYFNLPYYQLAYETNIPTIGIDLDNSKLTRDKNKLKESFIEREKQMIKVIEEFRNKGNCIVFVGDTHLRTIETEELGKASPIYLKYKNIATIIRSKNNEIE
jgi:hypothetical protein